jgi:hypothetical protein
MGLFWRLFAPKPLKKARRTVRKAGHPIHTATRAVTPKPVKQLKRAAHPVSLAELKIEDAAVSALRGQPRQKKARPAAQPSSRRVTTSTGSERGRAKPTMTPGEERPAWMVDGMEAVLLKGAKDLDVVGESYYQENLWHLVGPHRRDERVRSAIHALLVAEDANPYDTNAVAIWIEGLKVGHLSRAVARRCRPGLLHLQEHYGQPIAIEGVIVGGGIREDGPGRLGVFLRYDPADFGL